MNDEQSAAFQLFIITKRYTLSFIRRVKILTADITYYQYKMYFSSALKGHSKNIYWRRYFSGLSKPVSMQIYRKSKK